MLQMLWSARVILLLLLFDYFPLLHPMSNVMRLIREVLLSSSSQSTAKVSGSITYIQEIDLGIDEHIFLFEIERNGCLYLDFASIQSDTIPQLNDKVEFTWHPKAIGILVAKILPEDNGDTVGI